MIKKLSKSVILITFGCFIGFFLYGFMDNLKGPVLPVLLKDLKINYSLGGTLLLTAYIGYFLATLLAGMLSELTGKKTIMVIAGIALLIGTLGFSLSKYYILLVLFMFFIGVGLGSIQLGGNGIIVDIHDEQRAMFLNLLAFFHGLGSMLAPLYAGKLLDTGSSWRSVYLYSLLIVVILPVFFLFARYPKSTEVKADKMSYKELKKVAFTKQMVWLYGISLAYVAAEVGIGSWLVEFLQKTRGQSVSQSTLSLSIYFGLIMVGRFIGSFIVEKVGYIRIMMYASIAATISIVGGVFGSDKMTMLLPVTGLFFSILFPTATAIVSKLHTGNNGAVLGIFFSFAGLGGMFGPWLIALGSDLLGIRTGMAFVGVFSAAIIVFLFFLSKCLERKILSN